MIFLLTLLYQLLLVTLASPCLVIISIDTTTQLQDCNYKQQKSFSSWQSSIEMENTE